MSENRILVFIAGSSPTKEERALAEKHSTKCFRNAQAHSPGNSEPHRFAVAVSDDLIPDGYKRAEDLEEPAEEAPTPKPKDEKLPAWKKNTPAEQFTGIAATEE